MRGSQRGGHLGVVKAAEPGPITSGGTEIYRISVTNHGPPKATSVASPTI